MALPPFNCTSDFECPGNYVCFSAEVIDPVEKGCYCSTWYGWKGANCDELGTQGYWSLTLNSLLIIGALIGIGSGLASLIELMRIKDAKIVNASNITAFFATAGLCCMVVFRATLIAMALTPEKNDAKLNGENEDKFHEFYLLERIFLTLTMMFATLAALNISLMWIEIAQKSKKIRKRLNGNNNLSWYRITIYVFEVTFTLAMFVVMGLSYTELAPLIALPFMIFIAIAFVFGQRLMSKLLGEMASQLESSSKDKSSGEATAAIEDSTNTVGSSKPGKLVRMFTRKNMSTQSNNRYRQMIRSIQNTSLFVIIFLALSVVSSLAYSYMSFLHDWREYANPAAPIAPVVLANELVAVGILGSYLAIVFYCLENMRSTIKRLRERDGAPTTDSRTNSKEESFTAQSNSKTTGGQTSFNSYFPTSSVANVEKFQHGAASFHEEAQFADDSDEEDDYV